MLKLHKYSGSGNTFLLIDFRQEQAFPLDQIPFLCAAHNVDGLIFLENSDIAQFRMRIFNADGSEPSMCGNGLRCAALFIKDLGFTGKECTIETSKDPLLQIHTCHFADDKILTEMGSPQVCFLNQTLSLEEETFIYDFVNTGTPHAILDAAYLEKKPFTKLGEAISWHPIFGQERTNVNFFTLSKGAISLRTYEKGVERETLACGTGAVAAALAMAKRGLAHSPIEVKVASGEKLIVSFSYKNGLFERVGLLGNATRC